MLKSSPEAEVSSVDGDLLGLGDFDTLGFLPLSLPPLLSFDGDLFGLGDCGELGFLPFSLLSVDGDLLGLGFLPLPFAPLSLPDFPLLPVFPFPFDGTYDGDLEGIKERDGRDVGNTLWVGSNDTDGLKLG